MTVAIMFISVGSQTSTAGGTRSVPEPAVGRQLLRTRVCHVFTRYIKSDVNVKLVYVTFCMQWRNFEILSCFPGYFGIVSLSFVEWNISTSYFCLKVTRFIYGCVLIMHESSPFISAADFTRTHFTWHACTLYMRPSHGRVTLTTWSAFIY